MSAGRSMATDLPTPSGMKRDVASLAATWMTATGVSAACSGLMGARPAPASSAASDAVRINVFVAQCPVGMSLRSPRSFISESTACSRQSGSR